MIRLPNWRDPRCLALISGLMAALAHPPFGVLPGLLGYGLLHRLVDIDDPAFSRRSAFLRGWLAGLGYFTIGTAWIAEPFMVDADNQAWMAPFAVLLMVAGLALFWGLALALYRSVRPRTLPARVLTFTGCLAGFEWLRGHLFTGFPWNLPGESWLAGSAPSQAAATLGAYGLTWLTIAISVLLLQLDRKQIGRRLVLMGLGTLAALYGWGHWALAQSDGPIQSAMRVRLVQADIPQEAKYDLDRFRAILDAYLRLTRAPAVVAPTVIIWPEGAIPAAAEDYLAPGSWTRQAIIDALKPGQILMMGAYHMGGGTDGMAYRNGLLALERHEADLSLIGVYDKYRLVPFGEYLPFDRWLTAIGFKTLTHIGDGFAPGPAPEAMQLHALPPFQPMICYEALFPDLIRPGHRLSARWIVNVSNDAWFGRSSGPRQHFNLAAYRAIEQGVPMFRATPTGITALIDARGRTSKALMLDLGATGVIDSPIPAALATTLYRRWGDLPFGIMVLLSMAASVHLPIALPRKSRQERARNSPSASF